MLSAAKAFESIWRLLGAFLGHFLWDPTGIYSGLISFVLRLLGAFDFQLS